MRGAGDHSDREGTLPEPPAAALTSSQPLARGLLRGAHGWSAARSVASRGDLVGRLGLGCRSLALGKEICGDSARGGSGRGGLENPRGGRSGGAVPARAKVRGGSALFMSPRDVLCKHFPSSRSQAPRGCRAHLTPSAPRWPRPAAPGEGPPWRGTGPRSERAGARRPLPPALAQQGGDRGQAQPRPSRRGPFNATGGGGDPPRPPRAGEHGQLDKARPDQAGAGRG